jgi:hypothetical protein
MHQLGSQSPSLSHMEPWRCMVSSIHTVYRRLGPMLAPTLVHSTRSLRTQILTPPRSASRPCTSMPTSIPSTLPQSHSPSPTRGYPQDTSLSLSLRPSLAQESACPPTIDGPCNPFPCSSRGELNTGRSIRSQFHPFGVFPRSTLESPEGTHSLLSTVIRLPTRILSIAPGCHTNREHFPYPTPHLSDAVNKHQLEPTKTYD